MSIRITVCYADELQQLEIPLIVEENCTVAMAIKRSGILQHFSQINLASAVIGVYAKTVALDDMLRDQDRIEIYRPLKIDPKEARRLRAKKKSLRKL